MERARRYFRMIKNNNLLMIAAAVMTILIASAAFFILNEKKDTISVKEAGLEVEAESGGASNAARKEGEGTVFVDVSGCVKKPGVYEVSAASRIFEVIELAGGVTPDADTSYINQAEPVTDGLKINVPDKNSTSITPGATQSASQGNSKGKININTADSTQLQDIPGVGPATAEKIISYRDSNGYFTSVDQIKNVSGIGDKTFEKMKDMITI